MIFKIREIVDIITNDLWPDFTDEIRLENQDVCFKITLLKYCPFPNGNRLCITEYIDKESLDKMFELAIPAMAKSIIDRWKRSLEHEFFLYKEKHATVAQLYDALKEVGDDIGHWMLTPNNYIFNGLTPVQVIERGDIKLIWDLVYQLRSGMPQ